LADSRRIWQEVLRQSTAISCEVVCKLAHHLSLLLIENKQLNKPPTFQIADRLGATLTQLVLAWSLRNNTSQCVIVSAGNMEQLCMLFNSLQLLPKLTNAIMDEIDKVLSNKPVRPPMVSTLQQRWAATGGMPPQ